MPPMRLMHFKLLRNLVRASLATNPPSRISKQAKKGSRGQVMAPVYRNCCRAPGLSNKSPIQDKQQSKRVLEARWCLPHVGTAAGLLLLDPNPDPDRPFPARPASWWCKRWSPPPTKIRLTNSFVAEINEYSLTINEFVNEYSLIVDQINEFVNEYSLTISNRWTISTIRWTNSLTNSLKSFND